MMNLHCCANHKCMQRNYNMSPEIWPFLKRPNWFWSMPICALVSALTHIFQISLQLSSGLQPNVQMHWNSKRTWICIGIKFPNTLKDLNCCTVKQGIYETEQIEYVSCQQNVYTHIHAARELREEDIRDACLTGKLLFRRQTKTYTHRTHISFKHVRAYKHKHRRAITHTLAHAHTHTH